MKYIYGIALLFGVFAAILPTRQIYAEFDQTDYLICNSNAHKELAFWLADFRRDLKRGTIENIIGHFDKDYHEREAEAGLPILADAFRGLRNSPRAMKAFSEFHELHLKKMSAHGINAVMQIEILLEGLAPDIGNLGYLEEIHLHKERTWKIIKSDKLSRFLIDFRNSIDRDTSRLSISNTDAGITRGFPCTLYSDSLLIPKYLFDYNGSGYDVPRMCALASHQIWGYQAFSAPVCVSAYLIRGYLGNHDFLFVSDINAHRIVYTDNYISDVAEKYVSSYGGLGSGLDGFVCPIGIDHFGANYILIADSRNDRIVKLQYDEISKKIVGADQYLGFDRPVDVATLIWEPWDNFFAVVQQGNNSIKGAWWSIGSYGSDSAKFDRPTSLAFWRSSVDGQQGHTLYVTDAGNNRLARIMWNDFSEDPAYYYYDQFDPNANLVSVDVDNKGSVYVVDKNNSLIYKFTSSLELIAKWGGYGSGNIQLNHPTAINVAHGVMQVGEPPDYEFVPIISGDVFLAEEWGDSTGIRRYEFGIDILDIFAQYYMPFDYPESPDYLRYKIWLSDYAYIKEIVYYDGTRIDSTECGIWSPGWYAGKYWQRWYIQDSSQYGDYVLEITATSIYDSARAVVRADTVERPTVFSPPIILEGPIFIEPYSTYLYEDCLIEDMIYKVCITAEDQNEDGWIDSVFWESNAGYFSDPWKIGGRDFVSYTTAGPVVHFTPQSGKKLNRSIEDQVFRVKAYDNHGFESAMVSIPLHIRNDPDSCQGLVYLCGDCNNDTYVNVADAVWILNYIYAGGYPPVPYISGEVNCDYAINVGDAVWTINYVFSGGNLPCDTDGDGEMDCHDYL